MIQLKAENKLNSTININFNNFKEDKKIVEKFF